MLDTLVPPDAARGLPGAGELGLAEDIAAASLASEDSVAMLDAALAHLEQVAGAPGFAALTGEERERVLREIMQVFDARSKG